MRNLPNRTSPRNIRLACGAVSLSLAAVALLWAGRTSFSRPDKVEVRFVGYTNSVDTGAAAVFLLTNGTGGLTFFSGAVERWSGDTWLHRRRGDGSNVGTSLLRPAMSRQMAFPVASTNIIYRLKVEFWEPSTRFDGWFNDAGIWIHRHFQFVRFPHRKGRDYMVTTTTEAF
jgi:hypothetical protein